MAANNIKKTSEESPAQPRFGAFLTMTAGLLMFFGMISRVGKINEADLFFPLNKNDSVEKDQLEEKRQKAIAVIGAKEKTEVYAPVTIEQGKTDNYELRKQKFLENILRNEQTAVPQTRIEQKNDDAENKNYS